MVQTTLEKLNNPIQYFCHRFVHNEFNSIMYNYTCKIIVWFVSNSNHSFLCVYKQKHTVYQRKHFYKYAVKLFFFSLLFTNVKTREFNVSRNLLFLEMYEQLKKKVSTFETPEIF